MTKDIWKCLSITLITAQMLRLGKYSPVLVKATQECKSCFSRTRVVLDDFGPTANWFN